eukprot:3740613-Rhodomonas_salina.1
MAMLWPSTARCLLAACARVCAVSPCFAERAGSRPRDWCACGVGAWGADYDWDQQRELAQAAQDSSVMPLMPRCTGTRPDARAPTLSSRAPRSRRKLREVPSRRSLAR